MVLTAQLNIVNHIFNHVVKESWCVCGLFLASKNIQGGTGRGCLPTGTRLLHVLVLYVVIPRALFMLLYSATYYYDALLEQLKLLAACTSTTTTSTTTTSSTTHN